MRPLAIELFAGTMSGTRGWVKAGGRAVGFDLGYEDYHGQPEPGAYRVIQDALTLHGSQFKDAAWIWASPPCTKYSYLAMPWSRSKCPLCKGRKFYAPDFAGPLVPCDCKENSRKAKELRAAWEKDGPDNRLFDACFRIQRESIEAKMQSCAVCGDLLDARAIFACEKCYIPLIVENVRGAIPWVGPSKANFGSFNLWGDVARVGKRTFAGRDLTEVLAGRGRIGMGLLPDEAQKQNPDGTDHPKGSWFRIADSAQGDRGHKVPGFRFDGSGKSFQSASVAATGVKVPSASGRRTDPGKGARMTTRYCGVEAQGTKIGGDWFSDPNSTCRKHGSRSNARKAASAHIAMIPPALSDYLARVHMPAELAESAKCS